MSEQSPDLSKFPPPWNYLVPIGRKLIIWAIFFVCLWLLRHFLPLVFLTFVFSYIAEHGVQGLSHRLDSRSLRTALVFLAMIGVLGLIGTFLGPNLKEQAVVFANNSDTYLDSVDAFVKKQKDDNAWVDDLLGDYTGRDLFGEVIGLGPRAHPTAAANAPPGGDGQETGMIEATNVTGTVRILFSIFRDAATITTTFLLALLFAFLIVRDLPRMAAGVRSLKNTRLSFVYDEVSTTVFRFGQVLGRFLEAQLVIAIINTALTALGMLILGIPSIAFLAGVVFLCSFIPVAGVFISTTPICLVTLADKDGGISLVLQAIAMILVVHMIEAYVLNPQIMGAHLHLNPVLVLAVLLVGHQLFGIWGLLLGVPSVTYVLSYAIQPAEVGRRKKRRRKKAAATPG